MVNGSIDVTCDQGVVPFQEQYMYNVDIATNTVSVSINDMHHRAMFDLLEASIEPCSNPRLAHSVHRTFIEEHYPPFQQRQSA